jgi:hypothetical protein
MELLGTHKVSFEPIRRLTIECYALASCGLQLLQQSDYKDEHGRTTAMYEELLSEKLLQLAISIRTKFYQGADHRRTSGFLEDTGHFIKGVTAEDEAECRYTLKDICDKVIHASSVYFILDSDLDVTFIELFGSQGAGQQKQGWMLTLLLPEVCEGILGWLDATDT